MDSFEWNKIAGAVLFALLLAVGLRIGTETLFTTEAPETPGYVIAAAAEGEGTGGEAAESQPIAVLLASADAGAGESASRKCLACHTFGEGEANKIGPNLWGVVMAPVAAHEGYDYSEAMRAYADEAGEWTFEHLSTFLTDPTTVVPGTKMAFPGLKDDAERANVIAYLRTLAADPVPLPEPEAATDTAAAEAAEDTAAEPAAEEQTAEAEEPAAGEQAAAPEAEGQPAAEEQQAATATEEPAAEEEVAAAEETQELPAADEEEADTAEAQEPARDEQAAEADEGEQEVAEAESAATVPAGDSARGETFAKRCQACHSFEAGGGNKIGPALFGVFNRPIGSVPDFEYSDAMAAFSEGGTKVWDVEALDTYLADPQGVVPGTKMVFPPVRSEEDRANVIAYLATLEE